MLLGKLYPSAVAATMLLLPVDAVAAEDVVVRNSVPEITVRTVVAAAVVDVVVAADPPTPPPHPAATAPLCLMATTPVDPVLPTLGEIAITVPGKCARTAMLGYFTTAVLRMKDFLFISV